MPNNRCRMKIKLLTKHRAIFGSSAEYSIKTIDLERVIYRDFKNGFDVEISNTHTTSKRKRANIYLWYDKRIMVKCVRGIPFDNIGIEVDKLYIYTCNLYRNHNINPATMYNAKYL